MKHLSYILVFFTFHFSLFALNCTAQSNLLHYNTSATYFEEALPIGNGTQGAMVYGGVGEDKISLNDITLWTGEPDTTVFSPEAYKALPEIREALFKEDYRKANELQKKIQGHYSQNYQPLGTLTIRDMNETKGYDYQRTLDLGKALASVRYMGEERNYFASAPDSVIVIRLKATDGKRLNKTLSYYCQLKNEIKASGNEMTIDGYAAWASKPNYAGGNEGFQYDPKKGIHFRTILHVVNKDGEVIADSSEIKIQNCTEALIIIANVTSFNGNDKNPVIQGRDYQTLVRARIDNAADKSYDDMLARHENDYQALYNRVTIDLGTTNDSISSKTTEQQLLDYTDKSEVNPDLEELYFNYGRYLLISCSRTEGVPANLQGLWNEHLLPPWSCNYTSNINVEENYWPAETANLSEMHNSLLTFIDKLPVTGEKTAKEYYGVKNGWCLAHNTDIWGMTCPVGEHTGDPSWANWNMGGTWISTHIWEHYAFSMDKHFLRNAFPTLQGAADFCMNWLVPLNGSDTLITAPCTSPENIYKTPDGFEGATLYGGFADMAMIRECLTDTRDAAIELGEDHEYIEKINNTLAHLLPYRIGKKGNLQEWFHDWDDKDPQHRHQSHLFGLYPGHQISVSRTPELAAACKKTLEIKGDRTTGWSTGWRVNLQARLREAESAYHIYRMLLSYISPDGYKGEDRHSGGGTYPNLLDAHSPFQIDGNFGGTAGVIEMLVQSELVDRQRAVITLLPSLPESWKAEGSVKGVRCRGGYTIDFSWKDGEVKDYQIYNNRPGGKPGLVTILMNEKRIRLKK